MALPNEPITRQEMYLSNIAGQNTALPDAPITREEMYLDYIAKSGGTGEGDMKKSIYDSDNSVATAGGIKMFVNQKIGTIPQKVGTLETKVSVLEGEVASIEDDLDALGTASTKNSTSVVTESSDLVESGAVYDALGFGTKNMLNPDNLGHNTYNSSTGAYESTNSSFSSTTDFVEVEAGATYCISKDGVMAETRKFYYTADGTFISSEYNSNAFTIPANATKFKFHSGGYSGSLTGWQMEKGSTVTAYEPYHASVEDSLDDKLSYADNGVLGAKNRLSYTLDKLKSYNQNGTWNGNAYTINGVTYTINSDNSITINGTQNGSDYGSDLYLCGANTNDGRILVSPFLNNQKLSVGVAVDYDKLRIGFWYYDSNKSYTGTTNTIPNGEKQVVLNPPSNAVYTTQYIRVTLNSIVSNLTIYPMLYAKDDTDDTYRNYAQTNRELTVNKTDNSVIGTVEDGTNPTKAYAVGEHMIRGGKFCTVTVAVTTSSTWTEGSNYTRGDVADELDFNSDTFTTSFTLNTVSSNFVKKKGGVCYVAINLTDVTANAFKSLANIPSGYRPPYPIVFPFVSGDTIAKGIIYGDGNVVCTTNLSNVSIYIDKSYIL